MSSSRSTPAPPPLAPVKRARLSLFVAGLAALLFGLTILAWPTKAVVAITAIIAVYAIVAGIAYVATGLFSRELGVGGRFGHAVLGVLYVVAGVLAFTELAATAAFLMLFVAVLVGVLWIIEGLVSLFTLGRGGPTVLTAIFATISILAGFTLVTSPLWGAVFLWWFLGIVFVVLGVLNALRALFSKLD